MADGADDAPPLDGARFATLMAALEPFGPAPRLAVGVSGGPDSLALVLLAADWAGARGGRVTALTVDHGLRPDAAVEARRVAGWMAAAGVDHQTLTIAAPVPASGVQAWARARRLDALEAACRRLGVIDLLLAHHCDDQAETVLLRLGRGSGPDGLAAMAPESWRSGVRLLRPLLAVPATATRACGAAPPTPWIEDPSNADPAYQRVRLRRLAPALEGAGLAAAGLALTAARAAEARAERADRIAARLVMAVTLHPAGFATVSASPLLAPPDSEARAALGRLLACLGGLSRPPTEAALARLLARLRAGDPRGASLGRCRWLARPPDPDGARWLVCRERRHLPAPLGLEALAAQPAQPARRWDGRFLYSLPAPIGSAGPWRGWTLAPLGRAQAPAPGVLALASVPAPARVSLPVLFGPDGGVYVPNGLGYTEGSPGAPGLMARFAPCSALTEGRARLASDARTPM